MIFWITQAAGLQLVAGTEYIFNLEQIWHFKAYKDLSFSRGKTRLVPVSLLFLLKK